MKNRNRIITATLGGALALVGLLSRAEITLNSCAEYATPATEVADTRVNTAWGVHYQVSDANGTYQIVKVTSTGNTGTWTVPANENIEFLVVGGGGAGGRPSNANRGGGGGAGGLVWSNLTFSAATELTLTVGGGGAIPNSGLAGNNGGNSIVSDGVSTLITALGGGGGAGNSGTGGTAFNGGSGGGGSNSSRNPTAGTSIQVGGYGNAGGTGGQHGAGGGGAGGVGGPGTSGNNVGGAGRTYYITGSAVVYAAGGGGAANGPGGSDNVGGAGYGGLGANSLPTAGAENTGSGGGGGGQTSPYGGAGGSGIIVLRYKIANAGGGGGDEPDQPDQPDDPTGYTPVDPWRSDDLPVNADAALQSLRPASYAGPKILILGDSYSTYPGCITEGNASYYSEAKNGIDGPGRCWWYKAVKAIDGYLVENNSYSGMAIGEYSWNSVYGNYNANGIDGPYSFCRRVENLSAASEDTPDVIWIFGGTNDNWKRDTDGGNSYDGTNFIGGNVFDRKARPDAAYPRDCMYFKPAIAQMLWVLRNKYPNAKVMFIANSLSTVNYGQARQNGMTQPYIDAIEFMAKAYGCGVVKLHDIAKGGPNNVDDAGHPNATGMIAIAEQVVAGYTALTNANWVVAPPSDQIGTVTSGTLSVAGDKVEGKIVRDYGYQNIISNSAGHFVAIVVTNTASTYDIAIPADRSVEYMTVGGGGNGGGVAGSIMKRGGGGGAGALQEGFVRWTNGTTLKVKVGAAGEATIVTNALGRIFYSHFGGNGASPVGTAAPATGNDGSGGGAGGGTSHAGGPCSAGAGIFANAGGSVAGGAASAYWAGAGGGGAGGAGGDGLATSGGTGGAGLVRYITGWRVEYAKGGAGGYDKDNQYGDGAAATGSGGAALKALGQSATGAGAGGIAVFRYALTDAEYNALAAQMGEPDSEPAPDPVKVSIIGDSYSTFNNYLPSGYANYYPNGVVTTVEQTWWYQFISAINGELEINNSYSGSLVCTMPHNNTIAMVDSARLVRLGHPDVIVLFGGTNDSWNDAPRGTDVDCYDSANWTPANLAKFRPAYAYLVNWLKVNHPGARIICVVNSTDDADSANAIGKDYADDMVEIAAHYAVDCVQLTGIAKSSKHPSVAGMETICEQLLHQYENPLDPNVRIVTIPAVPASATINRDGADHRPVVAASDDYTVTMTDGQWIECGTYTLTLSLNDTSATRWSDGTAADKTFTYTISYGPTTTTGRMLQSTKRSTPWGYTYFLRDDVSGVYYKIAVATNTSVTASIFVPAGKNVEYLVVGGGGAGGGANTACSTCGGNAGEVVQGYWQTTGPTTATAQVGAGGIGTVTYPGAGGGSSSVTFGATTFTAAGGTGGTGLTSNSIGGTGGNGAGGAGTAATSAGSGCGGAAILSYITGSAQAYAGGGSGWKRSASSHGTGGSAGGITVGGYLIGTATTVSSYAYKHGVDGTGSGGAGATSAGGGNGGSGIVILRYPKNLPFAVIIQ